MFLRNIRIYSSTSPHFNVARKFDFCMGHSCWFINLLPVINEFGTYVSLYVNFVVQILISIPEKP
jgi:hypothetical protein